MKKILLASTSTLFGQEFLEYLLPEIIELFKNSKEIIFIPYARPGGISNEDYTGNVKNAFKKMPFKVRGIHEFNDPKKAIMEAEGIFTGGGNTFLLVDKLYRTGIMELLKDRIREGAPYLGTSAGTNIGGLTMQTTNDMPIVYPPAFKTLGIVPFNINPHYLDPDDNSTHKGETRETRIKEFHSINSQPVVGLREGSWLEISGENITLKGSLSARIFRVNQVPVEISTGSSLNDLN
ncbi:MAG: dipeptidase PepE [Gillisia sp.]